MQTRPGFYYADLGARQLGRGATGAAGAGDLSAIIYNPAGLADLEGLTVQIDLQLAQQHTSFTRSGGCGAASMTPCRIGRRRLRHLPQHALGSRAQPRRLVTGLEGLRRRRRRSWPLGGWVPTAIPIRATSSTASEVASGAPQRHSLISSSNIILYPGIAKRPGMPPTGFPSARGPSFRYFHIKHCKSIYGAGGISGDFPDFDAIASIDAKEVAYPVFDGGVIFRPVPSMRNISLGLSGRLGAPVSADGTISIETPAGMPRPSTSTSSETRPTSTCACPAKRAWACSGRATPRCSNSDGNLGKAGARSTTSR